MSRLDAQLLEGLAVGVGQVAEILELEELGACEGLGQPLCLWAGSQKAKLLLHCHLLSALPSPQAPSHCCALYQCSQGSPAC